MEFLLHKNKQMVIKYVISVFTLFLLFNTNFTINQVYGQNLSFPGVCPDFGQGNNHQTYLPPGTLLTGVIEDDIASNKNQAGDAFVIRLEEGYLLNGVEILPKQTCIIGTVLAATPAKAMRGRMPGELQVSLQTLVLPDGRHTQFYGFIDHNPNQDLKSDPYKCSLKTDLTNYSGKVKNSFVSILDNTTSSIGLPLVAAVSHHHGPDFVLAKGELIAVRVNYQIDLAHMIEGSAFAQSTALNDNTSQFTSSGLAFPQTYNSDKMPPLAPPISKISNGMLEEMSNTTYANADSTLTPPLGVP